MASKHIHIKQFDPELPLPEYKTTGAAAFDLCSRIDIIIKPKEIVRVPLNVAMKLPEGYWALQAARSSLHKKGLIPANALGIIDPDYCGDEDEYISVLYNFSDVEAKIERGERIVQVVILPQEQFSFNLVEYLNNTNTNRGGFGTTGKF